MHALKNARLNNLLQYVREQIGVSTKQFVALVQCLRAVRSHSGEVVLRLDTDLLADKLLRRAHERFQTAEAQDRQPRRSPSVMLQSFSCASFGLVALFVSFWFFWSTWWNRC